jgi:hypothetical protein
MATFEQRVAATEASLPSRCLFRGQEDSSRAECSSIASARSKDKRKILRRGRHASGTPRFSAESPLQCGASWLISSPRQGWFEAYLLRALRYNYLAAGE